jgi:hypothetical protein
LILLPLTAEFVLPVARQMRESDRREIFATRQPDDRVMLAHQAVEFSRFGAVFGLDSGELVAALGAVQQWPGVWTVWMFATPLWPRLALGATRYVRRILIPQLLGAGAHRAECKTIAGHHAAQRWMELLGAHHEATHPDYGIGRETFFTYAWSLDDVSHA